MKFFTGDEDALEALGDFNAAIAALYRLDVGAYSAMDGKQIEARLGGVRFAPDDMAMQLETVRNLIFGDMINWRAIADESGDGE